MKKKAKDKSLKVLEDVGSESCEVPLLGKDEMNLIEFPFGPITHTTGKTLRVEHEVFDKALKRHVTRRLLITGSDAFGLPRPIDDQVLIGMKALTYEAGGKSREVRFSRYELCHTIGWEPDGRAYRRLEESFDRIAGTTLKFKDAWWDKGERAWKSETFHLIERVSLCSRDEFDRRRLRSGQSQQKLCSFLWSDIVWKSFQDGFIKTLDMNLFRRVASGKRREVPLRLFRIIDKRFHYGNTASFELERLCVGTLGLSPSYSPSQMYRILERAVEWLIECGFLSSLSVPERLHRSSKVTFVRAEKLRAEKPKRHSGQHHLENHQHGKCTTDAHTAWLSSQDEKGLLLAEEQALLAGFGSDLERRLVEEARVAGTPVRESGRIRTEYIRKFLEPSS